MAAASAGSRGGGAPARALVLAALAVGLVAAMVAAATVGPVELAPARIAGSVARALGLGWGTPLTEQQEIILWSLRLPRVVLGAVVGAALAAGGVAMQGLTRNPLAEPSLLGVSSGAAVGACAFIVLGAPRLPAESLAVVWLLPGCAFVGALAFCAVALLLSRSADGASALSLLLGGVALAALGGAVTGLLVFLADDAQLRSITFWTLGSVAGATWASTATVAIPTALAGWVLWRRAGQLDRLQLGEAEARLLGVPVPQAIARVALVSAACVGAAVASCGGIGFVGLVVAHAARSVLGPAHRGLVPAAMLCGALLVVAADSVARSAVAPAELPVGVVTALVGAPVLLGLVRRRYRPEAGR